MTTTLAVLLGLILLTGCDTEDAPPDPRPLSARALGSDSGAGGCVEGLWCECPSLGAAWGGHTVCEPEPSCVCLECIPGEERSFECASRGGWVSERCTNDGSWPAEGSEGSRTELCPELA